MSAGKIRIELELADGSFTSRIQGVEQDAPNPGQAKAGAGNSKGANAALEALKGISQGFDDREAAAREDLLNPDFAKESKGYREQRRAIDKNLRAVADSTPGGTESESYKAAEAKKQDDLRKFRDIEVLENAGALREKTRELNRSLMTERAVKEEEFREEAERMRSNLANFRGSLSEKQKLQETYDTYSRAKQAQIDTKKAPGDGKKAEAEDGPLNKLMKKWGDTSGQLEAAGEGWLNKLSDKLTKFVMTGKLSFSDFTRSVITDLAKIGVQEMLVKSFSMLGHALGASGYGTGIVNGATPLGMWEGFHTGGIVGAGSAMQIAAPASVFANAKRFHTGGFPGLGANEVPAILKKGEGVFTPEQMAALGGTGGGQVVNQTVNVSVNGSAGAPEQNADLAEKIGRQVHERLRGMVVSEIQQQQRPGGALAAVL